MIKEIKLANSLDKLLARRLNRSKNYKKMANIRLNILPVSETNFSFKIFRRLKQENDAKEENIYQYHLPIETDLKERNVFLVSFEPKEEFEEYLTYSNYAIGLTKRFLLKQLFDTAKNNGCSFSFEVNRRFTEEQIEFTLHEFQQ